MSLTALNTELTESVARAASDAATRAGIEIVKLVDLEQVQVAVELHRTIWGPEIGI